MKTTKTLILALIFSLISMPVMPKSIGRRKVLGHNIAMISKMIKAVQPDLKDKKREEIAKALYVASKKYSVDPKIMIAIIATESNFNNAAVSVSGDISLAQINTKVWDVEFDRLGLGKLDKKMLKKDESYALNKMGKILSILQARHAKKDSKWYAIYHSKTKKFKNQYEGKVQTRLRMIASVSENF
ncbi:MAG: transglycosylase SLT domain-containing protein [Bdellovibrionales bacterium]|nr:transglycosylase SLT domain-containing protein [Bdellovibrionales bacterium]